jgi:hypothetical protein
MTTIEIDMQTKEQLDKLKAYPREPYKLVIKRLAKMAIDAEPVDDELLAEIEGSLADLKNSRTYTTPELRKKLREP